MDGRLCGRLAVPARQRDGRACEKRDRDLESQELDVMTKGKGRGFEDTVAFIRVCFYHFFFLTTFLFRIHSEC